MIFVVSKESWAGQKDTIVLPKGRCVGARTGWLSAKADDFPSRLRMHRNIGSRLMSEPANNAE
jgi:hypothetical protein